MNVAQIIRAKVPAHTMTITEMPIKKYFTFHRSAHTSVCNHEQDRTEYREMTPGLSQNENNLV
ncbi:hypothetical protein BH713_05725 [Enterobacter kobei]|uniref:Uncharacterized protein n=1 Tax=Enterobacter kobei TaxID=208224 RepID=A0ACC8S9K2_9ENTR|nr:hypothetical protein BH713_05725 [Enterobacter kobei]